MKNREGNIDINLKLYQKYYIRYLFEIGKITNYFEACIYFQNIFPKAIFKLTEEIIKKLKNNIW